MDDRTLLAEIAQKNTASFELFITKYSPYVATIVARVGHNLLSVQDIEEITADVFISVWKNSDRISPRDDSLKTYLAAMARNRAKTVVYTHRVRLLPLNEDILACGASVEDSILEKETCDCVRQKVLDMDAVDREIFIRRYYYFEKVSEIAAELSLNKKTVETRLIRGRKKLRSVLTAEEVN